MQHSIDRKNAWRRIICAVLAVILLGLGAFAPLPPVTAYAETQEELQQRLEELQQQINRDQALLNAAKNDTKKAKEAKAALESKINSLKQQLAILSASIAQVQSALDAKQQEIEATEAAIALKIEEIDQKQAEIDSQWDSFKQRMAAMQQMRSSGTMSLLSALQNLHQFLTFSEVLQDISNKDTEILDRMQNQLLALAQAKAELEQQQAVLEAQKAELEAQKAELDNKKQQLNTKRNELASDLAAANQNLQNAQAAQEEAQQAVDDDVIDYNAVYQQIAGGIDGAAAANPNLSFSGFICPLQSYSRISSGYGTRIDPITGKGTKMHYGQDWAAPAGTPIYAAAGGFVVQSQLSSSYGNYVLIYHGTMSDGNTYSTLYAHMTSRVAVAGNYVAQGQLIGYVGSTGNSSGNHLHLEVWRGSSAANTTGNKAERVNPTHYIPLR